MKSKATPKPRSNIMGLLKYLAPYKSNLIIFVLMLIMAIGAGLGVPYLNSIIVNNVIKNADFNLLVLLVLSILVLMLFESTIVFLQTRVIAKIGYQVAAEIRSDLFERVQYFNADIYENITSGDMLQRVTNYVDEFSNFLSNQAIAFATNAFKLILVLVFMITLSAQLTLVILVSIIINFAAMFLLKNLLGKASTNIKKYEAARSNAVINVIKNRKLIRAYNHGEKDIKSYERVVDDYTRQWLKYVKINELFTPTVEILWYMGSIVLYFVSFFLLKDANLAFTIGAVVAFNGYITQLTTPLIQLGTVLQQTGSLEGAATNVFNLIKRQQTIAQVEDPKYLFDIEKITFAGVKYTDKRKRLINKLDVEINKGDTVGFVSAKKPQRDIIAQFLLRYVDIKSGNILINNTSIKEYKLTSLRDKVVSMDKEGFVFNTTIFNNIKYANEQATDQQVYAAAKLAGVDKFVSKLPDGYETVLEGGSTNISLGQKQSISLARVLLHQPLVYIFDDITLDVSQAVKNNVMGIIKNYLSGNTVVIISTDEEMLGLCDKVVFIDKSNNTTVSTHISLMEQEEYAKVIEE